MRKRENTRGNRQDYREKNGIAKGDKGRNIKWREMGEMRMALRMKT